MSCSSCRKKRNSFTRHNLVAGLFALSGIGVLYFHFDPDPRGFDPVAAQLDEIDLSEFTSYTSNSPGLMKGLHAEEIPVRAQEVQTASIESTGPLFDTVRDEAAHEVEKQIQTASTPSASGTALSRLRNCNGEDAVKLTQEILEEALLNLENVPDYTATFVKQERIGGAMTEPTLINLKVRHAPFSVYMKWLNGDKGRELLYVDGQNDGDMVVRVGGVRGRFLPALNLNPVGDLAMKESRHPITEVGIKNLIKKALAYRERDLNDINNLNCTVTDGAQFDKRDCFEFVVEYKQHKEGCEYRKSILTIDKELGIPVAVKNFAWPNEVDAVDVNNLDKSTIIENYAYTKINYARQLADGDFDKNNSNYSFVR